MFETLQSNHSKFVSDISERRECAMCGHETKRTDAGAYYKWRGVKVIIETWTCTECGLGGSILRRLSDGEVVRLSHLHTGQGFKFPLGEGRDVLSS